MLEQLLHDRFALSQFRTGQKEIIQSVIAGKDTLAVLPTGGGKSLCYQLPALALGKPVVVISPLIALMQDQVRGLRQRGLAAGALFADQSVEDKQKIFSDLKSESSYVLYVSPERVAKAGFHQWFQKQDLALIAVDEAHCVSQWGHDFRPEYAELKILKQLRPELPTLALTASATPAVLADIARQLGLKSPAKMVHGFYRPNLHYQVELCENEQTKLDWIHSALQQVPEGRVIIYCGTRRMTQELSEELEKSFSKVGYYNAGLQSHERTQTAENFAQGEIRILCATNAFGMGVDQPDVRLVIHYNLPANIDSLYQEMGRAGRDGKPSTCLLLFSGKDKGLQSYFIRQSDAPDLVLQLRWRNLNSLVAYAESHECRHSGILAYFQDSRRLRQCGHCDVCSPKSESQLALLVRSPEREEVINSHVKQRVRSSGQVSESSVGHSVGKSKTKIKKSSLPIGPLSPDAEACFGRLKQWRKRKADELDVPAFVVFSDRTLREIAEKTPASLGDLRNIHGVGDQKLERFGWDILAEVQA